MLGLRECSTSWPSCRILLAAVTLWIAAAVCALCVGPHLGDHEVIVAQIARQSLQTGRWVSPIYLDVPFLVKPPLPMWLVGLAASILPNDTHTGLPVSDFAARLPSALATLLTTGVLFLLARSMFSRRAAWLAASAYATCVGALLFAFNATAESLLTLFCTWAFAEFWWSRQARTPHHRRVHLAFFYVVLGLAMLAKGPMPLMVVALPIAVWWWMDRPTRLLAACGPGGTWGATRLGLRQAWPRLRTALTRLGLWWGLPLFLLMFLPWMIAVARQYPYAWDLWSYEYLDRAQGRYPGCHSGDYFYYLPILFGMMLPWCLSLPEAVVSPFLRTYRRERRGLTYAWYWVVISLVILSIMTFKKSYYILPAAPACALLLGPVLERFFFARDYITSRHQGRLVAVLAGLLAVALTFGWFYARKEFPTSWHGPGAWGTPIFAAVIVAGCAAAGVLFVRKHREGSLCLIGGLVVVVFAAIWCTLGAALSNIDYADELVRRLEAAGVPREAELYWASNRPDGRVVFYGGRTVKHVIDPYKLLAERPDSKSTDDLLLTGGNRVCALLEGARPAYIVFQLGQLRLFTSFFRPTARELFRIGRGEAGRDDDDWVVVTNVGAKPPAEQGGQKNTPVGPSADSEP